tara:strand:- start:6628 stop:9810 length:3183 start_codon:yes stop_codon:yes gene_type:complete
MATFQHNFKVKNGLTVENTAGNDSEIKLKDNSATALTIKEGSNTYLAIDTTNSAEKIDFQKDVDFTGVTVTGLGSGGITGTLFTAGGTAVTQGDTINVAGTSNEIEVAESSGTFTVGLPDDVIITGNLTVNGTTTTLNSTTVTVDDPIMTLGGDTAPSSDDNKDRGIEFRWHNGSAAKIGFFGIDDSDSQKFMYIPDASNSSEVMSGTLGGAKFGSLEVDQLTIDGTTIDSSADLDIVVDGGDIVLKDDGATFGGLSNTSGNLIIKSGTTTAMTFTGANIALAGNVSGVDHMDFDTSASTPANSEGRLFYHNTFDALAYYTDDSSNTIVIGQELFQRVYNETGSTIGAGKAVRVIGATVGGTPKVALADMGSANVEQTIGLVFSDIANTGYGYVSTYGLVEGIDTSGLTVGNTVFVGTAGALTETAPTYPNFSVAVGRVLVSNGSNGCILVDIEKYVSVTYRTTGDARFEGDVTVGGALTIVGSTTETAVNSLNVEDPYIFVGKGDSIGASGTTQSTGSGLNDAVLLGLFEGTSSTVYYVKIDGTGTPDTFSWSKDNFSSTEATGVAITGNEQTLDNGIKVKFTATTGHTQNDVWSGTAAPANVDLGFVGFRNTGSSGVGFTQVGLFFDVTDQKFRLFDEYDPALTGNVDTTDGSFSLAPLVCSDVTATTFTGALAGNAASASEASTIHTIQRGAVNATHYINFVDSDDASLSVNQVYTDAGITYNPSSNALGVGGTATITGETTINGGLVLGNAAIGTTGQATTLTVIDDNSAAFQISASGKSGILKIVSSNSAEGVEMSGTLDVTGATGLASTTISTLKVSDLTDNRLVIVGASGELEDDANLTFTGTAFTCNASGGVTFDVPGSDFIAKDSDDATTNFIWRDHSANLLYLGVQATAKIVVRSDIDMDASGTAYNVDGAKSIGVGTAASGTAGEIRATNDVTAYYSSDATLKENVQVIADPIGKLQAIRGVEFDWTDDYIEGKGGEDNYFVRKHDVGVIAQEVEQVLPEVVGTRDDGIKAVRYDRMVALLIEAVKTQQEQIEALTNTVNTLINNSSEK